MLSQLVHCHLHPSEVAVFMFLVVNCKQTKKVKIKMSNVDKRTTTLTHDYNVPP